MEIYNRLDDSTIGREVDDAGKDKENRPFLSALHRSVTAVIDRAARRMAAFGRHHNETIERWAKVGLFSIIPVAAALHILQGGDPLRTTLTLGGLEVITYCAMRCAEGLESKQTDTSVEHLIPHG